jgi:hypothetical protein
MTVKSLKIVDGHIGTSFYKYTDKSGSYESIDAVKGDSAAFKAIHEKTFTQNVEKEWSGLSTGAKIGIGCGIGGAFLLAFIAFIFYCVRQRRQGKAEKALADKQWDAQQAESLQFKTKMADYHTRMKAGHFAVSHMGHVSRPF